MEKIEYRVRPVTRYIVTRFHAGQNDGVGHVGSEMRGEYENERTAYEVGYALCKAEHERLGWPVGDDRIQYPVSPCRPPDPVSVISQENAQVK